LKEEELKKIDITQWEEKTHLSHLPMHHGSALFNVNRYLNEIEDILREAGMEGLGYQDQENEIEELIEDQANLNAYINSAGWEFQDKIDTPLYKGFQNDAAEKLSRINLEDYTTENTLEIKKHHVMYDSYGNRLEYDTTAPSLSMADFLGISSLGTGSVDGKLVGIPEEFKDFTSMFTMEYDSIKEHLKDKDGNPISLEEYLNELHTYGEFDNKMDKPFLEFVSCILDVTILKPLIEMCWGYDLITGEDLSDFERGMKGVFAVIDVVSLMIGIKASGVVKIFSKNTLKMAGKSVLLDAFGGAGAYGIGQIGQELGLPLPITLLMSMGAGIGIVKVGGRYLFKDQAGNVLLDVAAQDMDALRKGVSGIDSSPLDNPKIARDVVADPDAVYGYKPKSGSSLEQFDIDWSNADEVGKAKQARLEYLEAMDAKRAKLSTEVDSYLAEGKSISEIAEIKVNQRNLDRINSYIENGDYEKLEKLYERNLLEYGQKEGPTIQQLYEKYGSYEEVIYSSVKVNEGMNVILGIEH
jgi:hypothetical protein